MANVLFNLLLRSAVVALVSAVPLFLRGKLLGRYRPGTLAALWLCLSLCLVIPLPAADAMQAMLQTSPEAIDPQEIKALTETHAATGDALPSPAESDILQWLIDANARDDSVFYSGGSDDAREPAAGRYAQAEERMDYTGAAVIVWLFAAAVFFLWHTLRSLRYSRTLLRWARTPPREIRELYRETARRMGISRPPELALSRAADGPVTVGLLRRYIFLPPGISRSGLDMILAHELSHHIRRDLLCKWLMLAACSCHWFNPAAHILMRRFSEDAELACDRMVLERLGLPSGRDYGLMLLESMARKNGNCILSTGFRGGFAATRRRFEHLVSPGQGRRGLTVLSSLLCLTIALACLTGVSGQDAYAKAGLGITRNVPYMLVRRAAPETIEMPDEGGILSLESADMSAFSFAGSEAALEWAAFDTNTVWPEELPEGFDPERRLELGLDPGLGIRRLHETGITGQGVIIGMVGAPLFTEHPEYADRLIHYEELGGPDTSYAESHSSAFLSLIAGTRAGIAPDAEIVYVSAPPFEHTDSGQRPSLAGTAEGIRRILEINKSLPDDRQVRLIYCSFGQDYDTLGSEEIKAAIAEAKDVGVFVIRTGLEGDYGLNFCGAGREPMADPNDPSSYYFAKFQQSFARLTRDSNPVGIPTDSRTMASALGEDCYAFYPNYGYNSTVAYVAGLYALAVQVSPELTPQEFCRTLEDTAIDASQYAGLHDRHYLSRLIDPVGIIAFLLGE